MSDRRHTWGLIIDVLDVLERHGYHQADDQHTGRAVALVGDLARIYEGTQETPAGPGPETQTSQPGPDRPESAAPSSTAAVASAGMHIILAALDEAADYKRERADCCPDCADQSCGLCQHRLGAAAAYETLAIQLVRALDAAQPQRPLPQPAAEMAAEASHPAADKEAGQ